ncbi:MAG: sulfite exporter TauE/SafE family protein [Proteobacteria bacterium]|nr:sulfite exporter TauE/SafE family protein [Pseudomonadota bacterium]
MDAASLVLLVAAGIAGGMLSALAGGAAIFTFPALIAAGLGPTFAAAANMIALTPSNFLAALADRSQLPRLDRSFALLIGASTAGAALGAVLLMATPQRVFAWLVPLLLGFATILFAFAARISAWVRRRAAAAGRTGPGWIGIIGPLLPVSVYGGYFGAGAGILLVGVLSLGTGGDYRRANVTKNFVSSINCAIASMVFVIEDAVAWGPALAMMSGSLAGALVGARIAQVMPASIARVLVTAIGAVLTGVFAYRYWF